jgi:hypothetical protein
VTVHVSWVGQVVAVLVEGVGSAVTVEVRGDRRCRPWPDSVDPVEVGEPGFSPKGITYVVSQLDGVDLPRRRLVKSPTPSIQLARVKMLPRDVDPVSAVVVVAVPRGFCGCWRTRD